VQTLLSPAQLVGAVVIFALICLGALAHQAILRSIERAIFAHLQESPVEVERLRELLSDNRNPFVAGASPSDIEKCLESLARRGVIAFDQRAGAWNITYAGAKCTR
jgi:hypothetical protein